MLVSFGDAAYPSIGVHVSNRKRWGLHVFDLRLDWDGPVVSLLYCVLTVWPVDRWALGGEDLGDCVGLVFFCCCLGFAFSYDGCCGEG